MQLPKELLSEKNYEGTREPTLKEMEELSKPLDVFYMKLRPVEEERKKIKDEMQPAYEAYQDKVVEMDKFYQKAQLVSDKLQPLVLEIVNPQLREFEKAKELIEKEGKLYVEVIDEIEEKIKAIRATKK